MKFSRLKITGFKSFCDETDLRLETGLTGIVGPNGCGKSNLVEALRWVMGESSYKAMRASGMDDVIFSGSKNRPARNSAEVTLILDNSDRSAPVALNDADILEVSRRIERESGSAYRVNGREVRARDVQLLFADASTGSKSPALVRQGQIGELIAAKPVKRRVLLEEAAGISGLHSRRHEAELRLRAAEQNLERVDDVVAQIEEQLANLKRQARQATRYRNISGDIKKTEATLYHIRWAEARFEQKNSEALQGQLINKLADATHAEQLAIKAHQEIDERLNPLREQEVNSGAKLQRLKILRDQLEQEVRRASNRKIELEDRQKQIALDEQREIDLIKEANEIIASYAKEKAELEKQMHAEQQDINIAKQNNNKLNIELAKIRDIAQEANETLAQVRANRLTAQKSFDDAQQKLDSLLLQQQDIADEVKKVSTSIDMDAGVKQYRQELEKAHVDLDRAEKASNIEEKNLSEQQAKLEKLRPEFAKVQSNLSTLESEAATLARVLNIEDGSLWPSIVDELSVQAGYETALGAALGEDLEASSDKGAPIFWDEPADLTNSFALPKGAIALSEYVKAPANLTHRLQQIGLVEEKEGAILAKQLKQGQRLVTKQGALWRWDGFVAKADAPTQSAQRMAQRNRLNELDAEVGEAKLASQQISQQIELLSDAQIIAQEKAQQQKENWRKAQREIARVQNLLDVAQKSLVEMISRKSALKEAQKRIEQNINETKIELNEAQLLLDNNSAEQQALSQSKELQSKLNAIREKSEKAQRHLNEFESAKKLRLSRIEQLNKELESWKKRELSANSQCELLKARKQEIADQLKILDANPDSFTIKRQSLEEDIEAANADYQTASDRLAKAQNLYQQKDKAMRQAQTELSKIREELARVEERLKGHISRVQQIEQIVQETLSIKAANCAQVAGLKPDAPLPEEQVIERKLERLKGELERFGGVNLAAEREADEVKQRLEIMLNDKEDLIGAIVKLRSGISSLNKEGRARLNDAFDKVNSHFKTLFTLLFDGGEAELKFVESDDPLEAGLEIIARPPGKKPQIMTLLSGGEQALTALALIFAVFLTNPAPICVLDEVDAPLDDANVERFCNLLDEMCERTNTRFVVVTHNPITMSRCDRLFGVTMAERGVSQIVSVDLSTAHKVAEAS